MTGGNNSIPLLYRDDEAARDAYGPLVWYNPYEIGGVSQHMLHERSSPSVLHSFYYQCVDLVRFWVEIQAYPAPGHSRANNTIGKLGVRRELDGKRQFAGAEKNWPPVPPQIAILILPLTLY